MFKKRTRPANVRSKEDSPLVPSSTNAEASSSADPSSSTTPATGDLEDDEPNVGSTISDLMSLRRFRKQAEGLDLEKLNRGEVKKRKKKQQQQAQQEGEEPVADEDDEEEEGGGEEVTAGGLKQGRGDGSHQPDDEAAKMKRLVKASNFTQQTNALDVDKHMMAYIEAELLKRRGGVALEPDDAATEAAKKAAVFDPQEELYAIAEQYRNEQRVKQKGEDDEEGNVVNSMAMLTAIPEVDLGMDARLKNIEDTEKAKRDMLEARKLLIEPTEAENDFAAARFYRPSSRVQSDQQALAEAKREAQGLPSNKPQGGAAGAKGGKAEMATDVVVMERFKKRMRKN